MATAGLFLDAIRRREFPLHKSLKRTSKCRLNDSRCVVYPWRMDYNPYRPHSDLDYMSPTEFAMMCYQQSGCAFCFTQ
ncbi:MAG: integrase core domain-containing protein, partial [Planctomycetota bacterium]